MASVSSTGTMSSAGISSGLDVTSIVSQLMAVEKQPLTALQTKATKLQTQVSAIGQLQSLVSTFRDALTTLTKADTYTQRNASSTDSAISVSATSSKAAAGSYAVSVNTLAAPQTLVSAAGQFKDSTSAVGTGTLTIELGSWSGGDPPTAFSPKDTSGGIPITIGAGDNTLAGVRDKINAANAGVTASIVTDASGSRLSIRSNDTGVANAFRVKVADDDSANGDNLGLSRLAYDPSTASATQMSRAQAATDTQATINGIAVTSSGTTFADVIEGVTITANKLTTSPATLTVSANTDAAKGAINTAVNAYNAVAKFISAQTAYDATTGNAGLFQGDSTIVGLQNQLRSMISGSSAASGVFGTLSSLGVQMQKDGTLQVSSKLDDALKKLPEVSKALAGTTTTANDGLADKLLDWTSALVNTGGTLPSRTQSLQSRLTANQKDQDALSARLALTQKRLTASYSALDTVSSKYTQLNSLVSSFVTQLQNANKSS